MTSNKKITDAFGFTIPSDPERWIELSTAFDRDFRKYSHHVRQLISNRSFNDLKEHGYVVLPIEFFNWLFTPEKAAEYEAMALAAIQTDQMDSLETGDLYEQKENPRGHNQSRHGQQHLPQPGPSGMSPKILRLHTTGNADQGLPES